MAIKKVGIDNDLDDIMKEIEFMKGCRSPYIVRYFGSYFKENELWVSNMLLCLCHNVIVSCDCFFSFHLFSFILSTFEYGIHLFMFFSIVL